ncbi:MAG TPA: NUDIX domain-containing protein [Verrucomicrobiae bacterium]|nr:NUDIX domain-containing protein [Verrucomicrobiae bacterium]
MKKLIPDDSVLVPRQAKQVFQGKIFGVYQWSQQLFDGSEYTFEMLKRIDTVTAICVVNDKILVVDDEQPHLGKRRSFPGGRVDAQDADIQSAAAREIQEETGYTFKQWRLVKVSQPYRKIEWFVYLFLAWDVGDKHEAKPDPGEKIEVVQLEFDELKSHVIADIGYLGPSRDIFKNLNSIDDLLALPEFTGREVDR